MKPTPAEDVLHHAELSIHVPTCALKIPGIQAVLGLTKKSAEQAIALGNKTTNITCVSIAKVEWSWDTETIETYDEDGAKDTLEIRTELSLDSYSASRLEQRQASICSCMRALGIPFDCAFENGEGSEPVLSQARLSESNPAGYSQDSTPQAKPSFDDIVKNAASSSDLADFNDWLSGYANHPRSLREDAKAFEELLSLEGRSEFIDASAELLKLGAGPYSHFSIGDIRWDARIPTWIRTTWDGQNPLRRFASHALPIPLTSLVRFMDLGAAQPTPDDAFICASLDAFCHCAAETGRRYGQGSIDAKSATEIGRCLQARPALASQLSPEAKSVFDLNLRPNSSDAIRKLPDRDYALAEAHWLRGQSMSTRPDTAPSTKQNSL